MDDYFFADDNDVPFYKKVLILIKLHKEQINGKLQYYH